MTQSCRMERGASREAARRRAFTLVELLVVIAILSLLMVILLPSLRRAQVLANRTACLNNLRGIGLAAQLYAHENEAFPPALTGGTNRWMDLLKPYADKKSGLYRCPADRQRIACTWDSEIILSYGINSFRFSDNAHCFWYGVKVIAVRNPSSTILFADCTPGLYYVGGGNRFQEPVNHVAYRHGGGFSAAYCDGRAEWRTTTKLEDWDASQ
jgi:prepilin-type N-terminal cleavage/methylation domain-containing protein/prepilin-type processing-associated H-X9-DG protein